jgi:hypothetical protein
VTRKAPRTKAAEKSSEYIEFENLTRKLVNVPKREIDEQRAKTNGKKTKD